MNKTLLIGMLILAVLFGMIFERDYIAPVFHPRKTVQKNEPLYWVDSMEPQVHYPGPGKSHMGMELTPVYQTQTTDNGITISSSVTNNLGVKTAPVTKGEIAKTIQTVGLIVPNENNIVQIHTYAEGWIRQLIVKQAGETVKEGQLLLQLYSPTLINAQSEFLLALGSHNANLIAASQKRLLTLGISPQQISELTQTRKVNQLVNVYATVNGIVSVLGVREGMNIGPQTNIMTLVNLSDVWMTVEIFEDQIALVKLGQKVEASFPGYPGKIWHGEVAFIYPQLDSVTHTLKIRLHFKNADFLLKPNMYAYVTLFTDPIQNALSIPTSALILLSSGAHVIVDQGNGNFKPQPVTIGIESGDRTQIISGLSVGQKVVTSAQFLIDSESNLNADFERMQNGAPK